MDYLVVLLLFASLSRGYAEVACVGIRANDARCCREVLRPGQYVFSSIQHEGFLFRPPFVCSKELRNQTLELDTKTKDLPAVETQVPGL